MSSTSYFFDYMDFFKAEYNFSNRTSNTAGKFMTVSYLIIFFYLSVEAIISVLSYNVKFFSNTTSYDNYLLNSGLNTLNKLNMIAYVQIISKSGLPMNQEFTKTLFKTYFSSQVSSLKSKTYTYKKTDLLDFLCNDHSQTLIFCVNHEINSINDLVFISINKAQAKTPEELEAFFKTYSVRIHIDYYFTNFCVEKYFFDLNEWDSYFKATFPNMVNYNLFDYIVKTQDYYTDSLTLTNYNIGKSNVELLFQLNNMKLDTDPMFTKPDEIKALSLLSNKVVNSPNLFSFNVKMSKVTENLTFAYLKVPQAFANVMGIMEACKFTCIVFSLLFNFLQQNFYFFDFFFTRNIKLTTYQDDSPQQLITIIPLKTEKAEKSEKELTDKDVTEKNEKDKTKNSKIEILSSNRNRLKGPENISSNNNPLRSLKKEEKMMLDNTVHTLTNFYTIEKKQISSSIDLSIKEKIIRHNVEAEEHKKFSIFSAFKLMCCLGSEKRKLERRLILHSLMEVFKKTDVFHVFRKLREIDILKYLLLSERQYAAFDCVQKEQIIYDDKMDIIQFYAPYKNPITEEKKNELLTSFIEEGLGSNLTNELDKKLFKAMDESLI